MHDDRFRKRQRLSYQAGKTLPQRVVEALDVVGLPAAFADRRMLIRRQDNRIGFPQVMKAVGGPIGGGNGVPKALASFETAVANGIGDDLTGTTAQR